MTEVQIITKTGTTTVEAEGLHRQAFEALMRQTFSDQFVELRMYRCTRIPFKGCGVAATGYVTEGGTGGGRVLATIKGWAA